MDKLLDILVELQKQHPNIYIGGSTSLILQETIPYRIPKDIDLVSINYIHIYDLFNVNKAKHSLATKYKHKNVLFDLFINPSAQYIKYNYNNNTIKLSPVDEIYQWKLKKKNIYKQKHINDLKYYEAAS